MQDHGTRRLVALINAYTRKRRAATQLRERSHQSLLNAYELKLAAWRESQEMSASDFNLLETLKIVGDEIKYSLMLAWLLDHRIERAGTHAQGNLGFRLFLAETGLNKNGYAKTDYLVSREIKGDLSRVDVEVAATGHFIIHLENKIYSEEATDQEDREDQTKREWTDLQRRARYLAVRPEHIHAFFVTLSGKRPSSDHFVPLAWHRIADVLDKFAKLAKPPEVSLFATHYACALRRMTQQITSHDDDRETEDSPRP
jgi:hypothetical protein